MAPIPTYNTTQQAVHPQHFDSIDRCLDRWITANPTIPASILGTKLTSDQCLEICGEEYGPYPIWMVISALTDWVIPLFLLLGNVTYSKNANDKLHIFGRDFGGLLNWLAVISHLLANPIDFLYSLCLKLNEGCEIKQRCDCIAANLHLTRFEAKDLAAVSWALADFRGGRYVDKLLKPLESSCLRKRNAHWKAARGQLAGTAQQLAHARRHNKIHSVLAIIMYGKDVFVALIAANFDSSFPYHMPHTLALRELYYWLFMAIILSAAAGGFENRWTSRSIMMPWLERRNAILGLEEQTGKPCLKCGRKDCCSYFVIEVQPTLPWDGGNYSWKHPKGPMTWQKFRLLTLVLSSVGLPVLMAFCISWYTPTIGLGDRGIMELSFAGFWVLNWILTSIASRFWTGWKLFRIMWWNLFWSLISLSILFAAFRGWFNSCKSWSAYYSRGSSGAYIDLNMKNIIQQNIFRFYLPMVGVALVIQLLIAASIIWLNKETTEFPIWSDDESLAFDEKRRGNTGVEMQDRDDI